MSTREMPPSARSSDGMAHGDIPRVRAAVLRALGVAAKVAVSLLGMWVVFGKVDVAGFGSSLDGASLPRLVVTFMVFLLVPIVGGLRWWMTLRGLRVRAQLGELVALCSIACVVGQILPTLAGDGVRLMLAVRQGYPLRATAQSVFLERLYMMLALLLVCAATGPGFASLMQTPRHVALTCGLLACAAVGFAVLLTADGAPKALATLQFWPLLSSTAAAARLLGASLWGAGLAITSVVSNFVFTIGAFLLAWTLGAQVSFWEMLAIMPVVTVASTLPISLGGWGVREGTLVLLLGHCGVPAGQALALSVLFGIFGFSCGVPGSLVWVFAAWRRRRYERSGRWAGAQKQS